MAKNLPNRSDRKCSKWRILLILFELTQREEQIYSYLYSTVSAVVYLLLTVLYSNSSAYSNAVIVTLTVIVILQYRYCTTTI
jgi:hypothetical protein